MSELVINEKMKKLIDFGCKLNEGSYKKFRNDLVIKSNYRIKGFVKLFDNAREGNSLPDELNLSSEDIKTIEALYDKYILVIDEQERFSKDSKVIAFRNNIMEFKASVSEEEFKNIISQYPTIIQFYLTDINDDEKCATWRGMFSEKDEKAYEELFEATLVSGNFPPSAEKINDESIEESQDKPIEEIAEEDSSEKNEEVKAETHVEEHKELKKAEKMTFEAFNTFMKFIKNISESGYNVIMEGSLPDSIKDIIKSIHSGKLKASDLGKLNAEEKEKLSEIVLEVHEHISQNQVTEEVEQNDEKVDEFVTEVYKHITAETAEQDETNKLEYQSGYYRNPGIILPIGERRRKPSFLNVFGRYKRSHKNSGNIGEDGMYR